MKVGDAVKRSSSFKTRKSFEFIILDTKVVNTCVECGRFKDHYYLKGCLGLYCSKDLIPVKRRIKLK